MIKPTAIQPARIDCASGTAVVRHGVCQQRGIVSVNTAVAPDGGSLAVLLVLEDGTSERRLMCHLTIRSSRDRFAATSVASKIVPLPRQ